LICNRVRFGPILSIRSPARQTLVNVRAAAISHVVKGRASGKHYSFDGRLPFVVGIDGVGTGRGQRVYFAFPTAPWGSMAQWAPVAVENCLPLPDALDDITAAAMANPGMSAWAALVKRAGLAAGETVLINGATGSAGQLAVQIARFLGAKRSLHRAECADAGRPRRRCLYRLNGR
jgi:NADPH:quinone reductase-like Zn-dependent oxidoreductase